MRTVFRVLFVLVLSGVPAVPGFADLNEGLVAFYPFNGNARDESGTGNHATVFGAQLTPDREGKPNRAYDLDGLNDYLDCGNASSLDITGSISLAAWICPESLASGRIISKRIGGGGYEMDIWDNNLRFTFNGYLQAWADLTGRENQWVFVAGVWDSALSDSQIRLYVDQEPPVLAFYEGPTGSNTGSVVLGVMFPPDYSNFRGKIDSVRIYNRALSEPEVRELFALPDPAPKAVVRNPGIPLLLDER